MYSVYFLGWPFSYSKFIKLKKDIGGSIHIMPPLCDLKPPVFISKSATCLQIFSFYLGRFGTLEL